MPRYILKKLCQSLCTVLLVTFITFLLVYIMPGDAVSLMVDLQSADESVVQALREKYALDAPFLQQYFAWLGNIARGDFGTSLTYNAPVLGVVLKRLTVTLSMGGCSLLISTGLGILLGFVAAECHGRWPDNLICVFSGAGTAMPPFLTAIVMTLIFSVGLGLLPVQGYTDPSVDFWDHVRKMILPCMVASFGGMMTVIRQTRASLLETVNKDFIRTAIAKGLRRRDIRLRHLLRNAILPVLSLLGMQVGVLFGGMVVVENIFNVPGMGSLVVTAVKNRDVPLIQMCILVMAVAMVLSTLAVDIAYGLIDPRMREVRADK